MNFDDIYKAYWQRVFRLCMGYVNDSARAKDIAQETFISVWQQLPTFRNESAIGTWIFRIASNHCLRHIEIERRIVTLDLPVQAEDKLPEPDEHLMQYLYQCISELPEVDRIIISLELEDVKQSEIAGIVGISEVNVRVRIHRIKEKLAQKFKTHEQ